MEEHQFNMIHSHFETIYNFASDLCYTKQQLDWDDWQWVKDACWHGMDAAIEHRAASLKHIVAYLVNIGHEADGLKDNSIYWKVVSEIAVLVLEVTE